MTTIKAKKKSKITKAVWFENALNLLAEGGITNVTVDKLSKTVGVAKTSFYWHFEGRQELLSLMLDYWINEFTEVLTLNPNILAGDPLDSLNHILELLYKDKHILKYDLAIRAWAQSDKLVAEKVEIAHNERLILLKKLLWDYGFSNEEAELRARMFVTYFSWQVFMMFDDVPTGTEFNQACLKVLLSKST